MYDRGPQPGKIMDTLINYHSLDIQWGNHDVLWVGAYAGSKNNASKLTSNLCTL
ncbi:fructose-bisphosphatase class III [Staphylococcus aureus]